MVMKYLKYIVLMLFAVLSAACESLSLPSADITVQRQGVVALGTNSATLEIVFAPTAATIQSVVASYSRYSDISIFWECAMKDEGNMTYRVELTNLNSNTTYYVRYTVSNAVSVCTIVDQFTTKDGTNFSVSATKEVTFSPGNLQYHPANNEWRFAPSQLDYIGDANSNCSSTYNGWLDLFGYSTSANNFGVSTSEDDKDYSGSFVDWGTNQIGADAPNTWRTLTYDEWKYLLNIRPNASSLKGVAQVNGVNGLILLPDNWTCPAGVTFKSGFYSEWGDDYYAAYQTFTASEWSKLEAAGAVFLPAAGYRIGSNMWSVREAVNYWSATENDRYAYCLFFESSAGDMYDGNRCQGRSVRLVKDL